MPCPDPSPSIAVEVVDGKKDQAGDKPRDPEQRVDEEEQNHSDKRAQHRHQFHLARRYGPVSNLVAPRQGALILRLPVPLDELQQQRERRRGHAPVVEPLKLEQPHVRMPDHLHHPPKVGVLLVAP
jgi:hypothetical protein